MSNNRQLTAAEREQLAAPLLAQIRRRMVELSAGDARLAWTLTGQTLAVQEGREDASPFRARRPPRSKPSPSLPELALDGLDAPYPTENGIGCAVLSRAPVLLIPQRLRRLTRQARLRATSVCSTGSDLCCPK